MQTPLITVVSALEARGCKPRRQANGSYKSLCPASTHTDTDPSLVTSESAADGKALLYCHAGCHLTDIIDGLGLKQSDLFVQPTMHVTPKRKRPKPKPSGPLTVESLARDKGLDHGALVALGLKDTADGVLIPYRDAHGTIVVHKRRTNLVAKKGSLWPKGKSVMPYGIERTPGKNLVLVEGESDCWTLWQERFDAIGLPGASTAKTLELSHLGKARTVYVVQEPDRGGKTFVRGIRARLKDEGYKGELVVLEMGCDVNDLFQVQPKGFAGAMREKMTLARRAARTNAADTRITIDTKDEMEVVVKMAETSLRRYAAQQVYVRGGAIVQIVRDTAAGIPQATREPSLPTIHIVPTNALRIIMASSALWTETNARGKAKPVLPPMWAVRGLSERGGTGLDALEGVTTTPIVRPDLSISTVNGYDNETGMMFIPPRGSGVRNLPFNVTTSEVFDSFNHFNEVFDEFPFQSLTDRVALLALALTIITRSAIKGPTPMFAVRAPTPGTGKSLIVRVVGVICTGREAAFLSHTREEDETRKRILAMGMAGIPLACIDNVEGPLGSGTLAAMLTNQEVSERMLGTSRMVTVPTRVVWTATGNNLRFKGDLYRRVVPIDMDAGTERPEDRRFRHEDLLGWVSRNRDALLRDLLTLVIGWREAGCPQHSFTRYGSYESWDHVVRSILLWAVQVDPCGKREVLRTDDDDDMERMQNVFLTWYEAVGDEFLTVREIISRAEVRPDLRYALAALEPHGDGSTPSSRHIGVALRGWTGRINRGYQLRKGDKSRVGVRMWGIFKVGVKA